MNQINQTNMVKYVILFSVVALSTFYIPNCSIINEHAIYIGLLAATTFALLDRYMPHVVVRRKN
jgi:hypothetical protein|tara:strand:+ start:1338 stop:1529 length:192 start_codon:yes stop_codon:yes gene_type:complete